MNSLFFLRKIIKEELDKMSSIDLQGYFKKNSNNKEWIDILSKFPEELQREIIDERREGSKEDIEEIKTYGHDLKKLQGKAMNRLRLMYPVLDMQLPTSRIQGTILSRNHPERRYAKSGLWNKTEAKDAVERAEQIYQEIIPKLILDGIIALDGTLTDLASRNLREL